jgi:hypothetical protein
MIDSAVRKRSGDGLINAGVEVFKIAYTADLKCENFTTRLPWFLG